ncbi:hypothetical protein COLO4_11845 [Corchorus olitorius]|uniref:Late embryogenesis abundant protein, LEA-14 n=1 Tax=Corchorus olitorius TaxID=93759 RepID=A0A1R3K2Z2_9ROSI|nr:hypothetical protein COLO4_11845 [Corchorus olitorius]
MEEKNSSYVIGIPASFAAVRGHNVAAAQDQVPDSAAGDGAPAPAPASAAGDGAPDPDSAAGDGAPAPASASAFRIYTLLILIVALDVIALGFFLSPNPEFGLKCLSVSEFNISGSEITANWDAEFLIRNNRGPTLYRYLLLSVFYKDQPISEAVLGQPFRLLPKTMGSNYIAHTVALSKRIENQVVADAIARDWSQGVLAFTVRLLHDNDRPVRFLNVTCADVKVGFSNHSTHGTSMFTNQQVFSLCSTQIGFWLFA